MPGCCSGFQCAADQQFDQEKVAQELKRYHKKGPGPTTRMLADGIAQSGALQGTVLDVGAGFGALTLALLERGAGRAIAVDASTASLAAGREEASRLGRSGAIEFVHADFVESAARLPSASVVALDRVVCCYPSWERLLDAALGHTDRCLALSYPRGTWYVRLGFALENGRRKVSGNSFRAFVHPVPKMEQTIRRAGLELVSRRETWMWSVDVYLRAASSP
jgi:magnesium-protoporphyrin O-methyltransferase